MRAPVSYSRATRWLIRSWSFEESGMRRHVYHRPVTVRCGDDAAPVTTLFWVRHGEADSNRDGRFGGHSPAPLTARGVRQAEAAARALVRVEPTAIISSDLLRATQTAEPIGRAAGLPVTL